jgi:uncharacterized protein (UPF0305 family)
MDKDKIKKKFDMLEKVISKLSDRINNLYSENIELKSDLAAVREKEKYLVSELSKAHNISKEKEMIIKKLSKISELIEKETGDI